MMIFSGTSNLPLAEKIAKKLGISLGGVEIKRFPDGECRVRIPSVQNISGSDVFVLQSLSTVADQNLMELCLMGSTLKRLGTKNLTAVIPWLGYSKQDKEFRKGEAVSAELVAKFIEVAGFDKVITVELHSQKIKDYFKIPVEELSAKELIVSSFWGAKRLQNQRGLDSGPDYAKATTGRQARMTDMVVVSPDKGGEGRSGEFANLINLPIAYLDKSRDLVSGKVTIHGIDKSIKGKTAIIYDDIINTGSTVVETAKFLHQKRAKKIIFIGVHAVLAGEANKKIQNSFIDQVIITDTIKVTDDKKFTKLKVKSVSEILAVEMQQTQLNQN